ncbi:MAG: TolC family protein [Treponema sp.]|nr:TolC family protein [Treponema sp.]
MHRGFAFIVFLCLGLLSLIRQLDSLTISLDDVLELGFENSLSLQRNLIDVTSAEYSANRLWAEIFPAISGTLGANYSTNLFSDVVGPAASSNRFTYNIGVGINLSLNAGIPYAMRNIQLAYQTRLLNYEDARNQLGIQLTKGFFSLIADRDNLAVLADTLSLAQLQLDRNEAAFNNGRISELTLLQSRLGLENARYSLSTAQSVYINRMSDFLVQLGIDQDTDILLDGQIEIVRVEIDAEQLINEHLLRRPDIISLHQEIERLENAERQLYFSSRAPSVNLSAQWRNTGLNPFADNLSGSATLTIPIDPWISGTGRYQSVRNASDSIEKARLDLQSAEDAAVAQIRSLAMNLRNSWESIEIARLSLSAAERTYELTELGFRNGTIESLRLEDARNNLVLARQRLLQSELSYLNMILDISAVLNIDWKDLMQ